MRKNQASVRVNARASALAHVRAGVRVRVCMCHFCDLLPLYTVRVSNFDLNRINALYSITVQYSSKLLRLVYSTTVHSAFILFGQVSPSYTVVRIPDLPTRPDLFDLTLEVVVLLVFLLFTSYVEDSTARSVV